MKKYIIIAGVNGVEKSTLYQSTPSLQDMPRINTDEIVRDIGSWKNSADIFKAGKIAVRLLYQYLKDGISFNQETTLCGKSIIKNIQKAKEYGYYIEMHYIGIDSPESAKNRVHQRVKKGGHGIPDSDIEKHYYESFQNLKSVLNYCDLIAFYDNTTEFRRFAIYRQHAFVRKSHLLPDWFLKHCDF